ncbi:MAG: hypothetical protein RLZZ574_2909 [Cyanobacteriota bacterium]|jgi:hypothetical protein
MKSRITLCIPINLQNRQEIAVVLEHRYFTEYVFMGRIFQSTITHESCVIDIEDSKAYLANDLELAGQDKLDIATLQQINDCPQTIYLTSHDTGYDACFSIAKLAQILLQIGGIAIMVESTGIAHSKDRWLANYNSEDVFKIYSLFVMLIEGEDYYYSCGMHNFGQADVAITLRVAEGIVKSEDLSLAIYVMNVFNYYRLTESPILQEGHTFQPDIECSKYQLKWMIDRENTPDSDRHNPHGRWLLTVSSEQ